MATRISILWMTDVPLLAEGGSDFDHASWDSRDFFGDDKLQVARSFAQEKANANAFGQTWLQIERAPRKDAPEWMWERDYEADEIFEAE
jgi:hypothetical protein